MKQTLEHLKQINQHDVGLKIDKEEVIKIFKDLLDDETGILKDRYDELNQPQCTI